MNWKFVRVEERDIRLFRLILEQKFLTRTQVRKHVFKDKFYSRLRIWKLKKFDYLKTVLTLAQEPESYLLGQNGVEALRTHGYEIGNTDLPQPQKSIEIATYEHDRDVTEIRFLLENAGLCKNWHSEKVLRLGMKGERKVPDGYFKTKRTGVAIEFERSDKDASTYKKIFETYDKDPKIGYIFYICGDSGIMELIMRLVKATKPNKRFCFILFEELMKSRENAIFQCLDKNFTIKEIMEKRLE